MGLHFVVCVLTGLACSAAFNNDRPWIGAAFIGQLAIVCAAYLVIYRCPGPPRVEKDT